MKPLIIIRGGGDLASGVALRLYRVGFQVAILELDKPLAVRRSVSFSEAVYEGVQTVEGVKARRGAENLRGYFTRSSSAFRIHEIARRDMAKRGRKLFLEDITMRPLKPSLRGL